MKQRIVTALLLAPLAIAAVLFLPTSIFMVLAAAVLLLGLWEWTRLIGIAGHTLRALVLALNAALLAWLAWSGWPALFPWVALLGVLWWCAATLWLSAARVGSEPNIRNRAIKMVIGSLLILPAWCSIGLLHADGAAGPAWAFYALAIVWVADSGAYFVGSRIGGRKLAPSISPGKTWAGFWGGLAAVGVLALVAAPLFGLGFSGMSLLFFASLLTALASVIGDLFESMIKRHAGAKDSGDLFPGHGGMLDRIDSILAALPVFAIVKDLLSL
jgi:phosphatidate cytidylyltransferase